MFFGAFFGALFYTRILSVPWLGGEGSKLLTNTVLWPHFEAGWPSNGPGNIGGAFEAMEAWGLPAINTLLLITSSFTVTWAHHALKENKRARCIAFMWLTVALGVTFLCFQAKEYIHAYTAQNLTLGSGVYGSTFFMLTGFHGLHVTLGTLMLIIITLRLMAGHFKPDRHFGFEGVAWYWHFVDVVWIGLFTFVYVL
jgi:cytochrome c oxidase subunit 3